MIRHEETTETPISVFVFNHTLLVLLAYLLEQPGTIDEEAKAPLLGALREAWYHRLGSWAWQELFPSQFHLSVPMSCLIQAPELSKLMIFP